MKTIEVSYKASVHNFINLVKGFPFQMHSNGMTLYPFNGIANQLT